MSIKLPYKILSGLAAVILVACLCFYSEHQIKSAPANQSAEGIAVPVIMYHHILEQSKRWGDYVISPTQFQNDLKYLKEQGYTTVSGRQIIDYAERRTPLPKKPILITFDDGYESSYQYAYPILKEENCKAIISIIGKYSDYYSGSVPKDISYSHMNWGQIKELSESSFIEIGNHTYDLHEANGSRKGCRINKGESLADYHAALSEDIGMLQDKINIITKIKPVTFAYPFGFYCKESEPILKQMGIKLTLGCEEGITTVNSADSLYNMKRYNRAHGKSSEAFFKTILS
ncbi:MAG: polysaccharide deacetylase family protein [Clostridiales bacterium]|nr:polysaccharide deacetylase family protein [Clostridiales bacterium]